ncbi:MAG TPA: CinA family protein [Opitutaceae bacterium]|nr:CinA family protein [Opitutaceae bacterium]
MTNHPSTELKSLLLGPPRCTLAAAESLTCGRVQARLGAISGASEFFLGGITAYALEEKVRHLGVERAAAAAVNGVSAAVAEQMARGACALFGSDLAVATTGYAEPPAPDKVGAPFAWWALAHARTGGEFVVRSGRVDGPGLARVAMQERVAERALAELAAYLRDWRAAGG